MCPSSSALDFIKGGVGGGGNARLEEDFGHFEVVSREIAEIRVRLFLLQYLLEEGCSSLHVSTRSEGRKRGVGE